MVREKRAPGWFSGLNGWVWPFVWILLIPFVTAPLHVALLDLERNCTKLSSSALWEEQYQCPLEQVLPSLMPGLLNLVAFAWLLSSRKRSRYAGLVAGALGTARLIVPLLIYMAEGPNVEIHVPQYSSLSSIWPSLGLWLLSLGTAAAFPSLVQPGRAMRRNARRRHKRRVNS